MIIKDYQTLFSSQKRGKDKELVEEKKNEGSFGGRERLH